MPAVVYLMQLEEGGQEMTFTDDDFKTVEKELSHIEEPETEFVSYTAIFMSALLSRLEAAEKCIPYHECQDDLSTCPHLGAWRKAAGL